MQHATEDTALRQLWWQWTEVVELFARRRRRRMGLDPDEYAQLHAALLAACRARAAATSGRNRAFYYRLLSLAEPWLSQYALEKGEQEIVMDLCLQCQQVERELGARPWRLNLRLLAGLLLALTAGAGVVWLVIRTQHHTADRLLERVRGWVVLARWHIRNMDESSALMIAVGIVTLVGIYLVYRTTRSSST
jgi:hypothetical protein